MNTFSDRAVSFFEGLTMKGPLPKQVDILNPYVSVEVIKVVESFFSKYYADNNSRYILLGINPGRFGGGITGISFTDPVELETSCGIENSFEKRQELSSQFMYNVIRAFGDTEPFFSNFFMSAVCPLGFVKDGKNYNYYDDKMLENFVMPFIEETLLKQLDLGIHRSKAFCIGEGKNNKFLVKLNNRLKLFNEIVPLPHPRFVMQYRRKRLDEFINLYVKNLRDGIRLRRMPSPDL